VAQTRRSGSILIVDDEQGMREFLGICLSRAGYRTTATGSGADAIRLLSERNFDVVVTDLTMPGVNGMEVLRAACDLPVPPLVIMVTAFATTETAIEAMKIGAYDYLTKPFNVEEIQVVVGRALERLDLTSENRRLREALRGVHSLDNMIGKSTAMQKVFELVRRVAPTRTNVLIRGESGTGKELVARALHNLSERAQDPFVAVNCGAIPAELMESELFGHLKGSFTGATADREGVFAAAGEGTLFLDEIGELGAAMQVKLLRALQERKVRRVGASEETEIGCRLVAATNRNLEAAIEAGEFRNDLYFRLNVVQIVLPPLRHRPEDVPLLVQRFFERFNRDMQRNLEGVGTDALNWFLNHDYPGNVRELENLVERAVTLENGTTLSAANLPASRPTPAEPAVESELPDEGIDLEQATADLERRLIGAALRRTGGVRKDAAKLLSISLRSLRYRLEKLGIEVGPGGPADAPDTPAPSEQG
jgi:two-component system response regulator PilR (NtrC family)